MSTNTSLGLHIYELNNFDKESRFYWFLIMYLLISNYLLVLLPFTFQVMSSGQPCIMFQARKVALSYRQQKQLDLTEQAFSPQKSVDTSQSICSHDRATYVYPLKLLLHIPRARSFSSFIISFFTLGQIL